jgi:hypothetical protein
MHHQSDRSSKKPSNTRKKPKPEERLRVVEYGVLTVVGEGEVEPRVVAMRGVHVHGQNLERCVCVCASRERRRGECYWFPRAVKTEGWAVLGVKIEEGDDTVALPALHLQGERVREREGTRAARRGIFLCGFRGGAMYVERREMLFTPPPSPALAFHPSVGLL